MQEQVAQLERLEELSAFFSPHLAELIVTGGAEDPLKCRRQISVCSSIFRGFTPFAETNSRKKSWTCSGNTPC